MLVSIVIPACEAHDTIVGAVRSLIVQSAVSWEAIVVSDDGSDYRPTLEAAGIRDDRLVFVSTGAVRSGCHNARNVGLRAVRGEVIAALDADDAYHPDRFKALVPPALAYGAAVDNTAAVDDDTG